jgi:hypothetical protein
MENQCEIWKFEFQVSVYVRLTENSYKRTGRIHWSHDVCN